MARIGYSDAAAAAFQASRELPLDALSEWRPAIARHLAPRPGMQVLDLGAGTGAWATALARWYGISVVAVEPSAAMRARSRCRGMLAGHATALPLGSATIDGAWLSTVIHHLPDLPAAARELRRVLRPGAPVLIRNAFPGRHHGIGLFRYWPEAIAALDTFPTVAAVRTAFAAAGFSYVTLESVRQVTAPSLAAIAATARRESHTPLMLITGSAYEAGLARLRASAVTQQGPVIDTLDLLVLRADRWRRTMSAGNRVDTRAGFMGQVQIGLLHPGEMGSAVAGCLVTAGYPVLWASAGRGPASTARAEAAGLRDAGTVAALARQADIIVSVCPPHAALEVARSVAGPAGPGFGGVFLDANAVSPGTAGEVARIVEAGGASYVDGGIIGPPPSAPGHTRLYLSGPRAAEVRDLFTGTALDARVIDGGMAAASALKMAYAGWTKGTAALILAVRALARAGGVEDILLAEWQESQPGLAARSQAAASSAAAKGWRWVGEMEEIAASMAAAGLPPGFHEAAAEVFRRSPRDGAAPADEPTVASVLGALLP